MTRFHQASVALFVLALASQSYGEERLRRAGGAAPAVAAKKTARPSQAAKKLASYQGESLLRFSYRKHFLPDDDAGPVETGAAGEHPMETTIYGGSAGPFVMARLSAGRYEGELGNPLGLASYSYTFPYAYGCLATPYSYGVYGYPYYSFYRPSFAYSVWGWPGISPLGNFGYGGYGLPYGYYGLGGYNQPYGFGGVGFPYGRLGIGYPYGYGGFRTAFRNPYRRVAFPMGIWGWPAVSPWANYGFGGFAPGLGYPYGSPFGAGPYVGAYYW